MAGRHDGAAERDPQFDAWETAPELAGLRASLETAGWSAVEPQLQELDPETASVTLSYLGGADDDSVDDLLKGAVDADQCSVIARTALAGRDVALAWRARSSQRAENVSAEQFATFHARLERAERVLLEVCADDPAYVPAWALRQHTARGLELGRSEARRRLDRLRAVGGSHWPAERAFLQVSCPKWGGSWERAQEFVREAVAGARDGSASHALVAELYAERWIDVSPKEGHAALARAEVREELLAAASRSVWHESWTPGLLGVQAHSLFALAFSLGGHLVDAAAHFQALDGRLADSWRYVTHLSKRLGAYRTEALAALAKKGAA